jgi:hypothetical protein
LLVWFRSDFYACLIHSLIKTHLIYGGVLIVSTYDFFFWVSIFWGFLGISVNLFNRKDLQGDLTANMMWYFDISLVIMLWVWFRSLKQSLISWIFYFFSFYPFILYLIFFFWKYFFDFDWLNAIITSFFLVFIYLVFFGCYLFHMSDWWVHLNLSGLLLLSRKPSESS